MSENIKAKVSSTSETANYLRHKEAANFLNIRPKTLYKWCHEGKLKYYKVGSLNLYKRSDLEAFLESNVIDPQAINDRAVLRSFNPSNMAA